MRNAESMTHAAFNQSLVTSAATHTSVAADVRRLKPRLKLPLHEFIMPSVYEIRSEPPYVGCYYGL
jgi:hypothetical protein